MSVPLMEAMADAIYAYEGDRPPDRAYRNRNPGNLRAAQPSDAQDSGGYRVFAKFTDGYQALLDDIEAKITGENTHGLGPGSKLAEFFQVYAPASDSNDPTRYAKFVALWLFLVYEKQWDFEQMTFRDMIAATNEVNAGGVATA